MLPKLTVEDEDRSSSQILEGKKRKKGVKEETVRETQKVNQEEANIDAESTVKGNSQENKRPRVMNSEMNVQKKPLSVKEMIRRMNMMRRKEPEEEKGK